MGASASSMDLQSIALSETECKSALKELFDKQLFEAYADSDRMITLASLDTAFKQKTDVFLTHDWGKEMGVDNHERVARVNEAMKKRGLRTWFDAEKMEGNVKKKMISGIENSYCIVVFITQRYMQKVDSDNAEDNCQLEFNYSSRRKTARKMVPVVMEARMRDTSAWVGEVGMVLGGSLYMDLSSDDSFEARMDELYGRVLGVTGTTVDKVLNDKVWKELIEKKMHSSNAHAHAAPPSPTKADPTPAPSGDGGGGLESEIQTWIAEHTKIVPKFAQKYALVLVENGIGSIEKLRKKLVRNAEFLMTLDFDEDDAEEFSVAVLGDQKKGASAASAAAEKEFPDLYKWYFESRSFFKPGKDELYEAANSSDTDRAMMATTMIAVALASGGGTFATDTNKSNELAQKCLPWLQSHAMPPTDQPLAPSDVTPKPYALSVLATTFYAYMIRDGIGMPKDESKAVQYMKAAVAYGNSLTQFLLGFATKMGKGTAANKEQGVQYYRLAAAQGFPMASVNLGVSYYNGEGVTQDYKEAARFFRTPAEAGHARGMYELGTMYYNGEGVAKDHSEAARLFKLAHDKNYNDATYFYGVCLYNGQGVSKDRDEGRRLLKKAADAGSDEAKDFLTRI